MEVRQWIWILVAGLLVAMIIIAVFVSLALSSERFRI